MTRSRALRLGLAALLALALSGCGIMMGQMMVMGRGVKDFRVVSGDLSALPRGKTAVILAPFDTEGAGYEPARGDTAARFSQEFERLGLFAMKFSFVQDPFKLKGLQKDLAAMTPSEVKAALGLDAAPDVLITGTILNNEMVVAPMRGIVQRSTFRLTFTDLSAKKSSTVEVEVKEFYSDAIPSAARAVNQRVR